MRPRIAKPISWVGKKVKDLSATTWLTVVLFVVPTLVLAWLAKRNYREPWSLQPRPVDYWVEITAIGAVAGFMIAITHLVESRIWYKEKLTLWWAMFSRRKMVKPPPGSLLLTIAESLYSKKTFKLTFEVLIGDLRFEYNEALKEKRPKKANYIRVKYFFLFLANMGLTKVWSFFTAIKQFIK